MRNRELDEILEECLAAYLEGRRSVEESLSLYPSLAVQLEPLLRTAVRLTESLQAQVTSQRALETGRARFLQRARERRSRVPAASLRHPWRRSQLALLGGAVAAALIAGVALSAAALLPGGGNPPPRVVFQAITPPPTSPGPATNLRDRLNNLVKRANLGQAIDNADIQGLSELAARVTSGTIDDQTRQELAQATHDFVLSIGNDATPSADGTPDLLPLGEQMQRLGVDVRNLPVPSDYPSPSITPAPSATAQPSPSASPAGASPAPGGSPTPSEAPPSPPD